MLNSKEILILERVAQEEPYRRWFLKEAKDVKWFYPLKQRLFFDPENIKHDEGGTHFWDVLDYLERVSKWVREKTDSELGRELLEIIRKAVSISLEKRTIQNYHIWWYCVKILNNIPTGTIKDNLLIKDEVVNGQTKYGFRAWLTVWTDPTLGDLALADIGGKLLGKFLEDNTTVKYAEAIVDAITRVKASEKQSCLTEKAVLLWQPYWIVEAFRKHHKQIGEKCSPQTIYGIADKLRLVLEYEHQDYSINVRNELTSEVYEISVTRIPADGVKPGEIRFKKDAYLCHFERYSSAEIEGLDLTESFLPLYGKEPEFRLGEKVVEATNKSQFVLAVRDQLPQEIIEALGGKIEERLGVLFDGMFEDYSHVWCRSLDSGPEHDNSAEDVLTLLLRDTLLSKCEAKREEGSDIIESFLTEQYRFPIFRRFVLLCSDKYWTDYKGIFERFLIMTPKALEEPDYEVELQDILRSHYQDLSLVLVNELEQRINNVPSYYMKKGEDIGAHWKHRWLSPLKDHPAFSHAYNEAKETVKPKDGKPYEPERSAFKGGLVVHKAPLSKEDILGKPLPELVKFLGDFKGAGFWEGTFEGEPDEEGLAGALQEAAKDNPKKFTGELAAFLGVKYRYVCAILVGLKAAWSESKKLDDTDWGNILDFSLKYLDRDKSALVEEALQTQGEDSGNGKYIWVVETIVDLIEEGCQKDEGAFDPKHFEIVKQIFNATLLLVKVDKKPDTEREALHYALNTTLGKIIRAHIIFSLRVARATHAKPDDWGKQNYEPFFALGVEAYTWFGCYLANMRYLDQTYTDAKLTEFANRSSDDVEWRGFIEGYLTGSQVYKDLYIRLRPHYLKALENKALQERVHERLVQHICIGYLYFDELLKERNADGQLSLLWKMLMEAGALGRRDRWLETVSFFWSRTGRSVKKTEKSEKSEETSPEEKRKVVEFWQWSYDNREKLVKPILGDEYESFLGRIGELTIVLDKIDEKTEPWLLLSAPHLERHHDSAFFIEYLTKFEDPESVGRIGAIFKEVLKYHTPVYDQEDIKLLVRRLYEKGNREDAEAIVDTYGRRGVHFLKEVWQAYPRTTQ